MDEETTTTGQEEDSGRAVPKPGSPVPGPSLPRPGPLGQNVLRTILVVGSLVTLGFVNTPTVVYLPIIVLTALVIPLTFVLEPAGSNFRIWILYFVGFVLFAHLRTFADETGIPVRVQYVVDLERFVFGGIIPTVWLQERFYSGGTGVVEVLMMAVHLSYFFVPHAMALVLWILAPAHLRRYAAGALIIFALGLLGYFLVPTAPPWLATLKGALPGTVRVISDLNQWVSYSAYSRLYNLVGGPNPVAAMPSLHTALTVLVALSLTRWIPRFAWLGWAYAGSMGVALVYLGEHYAVDILAGLGTALVAWVLSRRWDAEAPAGSRTPDPVASEAGELPASRPSVPGGI